MHSRNGWMKGMTLPRVPALIADMDLRTPLPAQAPATEGTADLGTVKLWYWDTGGAREAVVFFHPGSRSAQFFPPQQPVLPQAGYPLISSSPRRHFKSELRGD